MQPAVSATLTRGGNFKKGSNPTEDPGETVSGSSGGAGYAATSTTSLTIGTGSTTFTTQSGLAYTAGAIIQATDSANVANYMYGTVTSYSGTTLVVNVTAVGGSGTFATWNINLAGQQIVLPTVTPEQYGAKGDGTTDDRTDFQLALNALSPKGGTLQCNANHTYLMNSYGTTTAGDDYSLFPSRQHPHGRLQPDPGQFRLGSIYALSRGYLRFQQLVLPHQQRGPERIQQCHAERRLVCLERDYFGRDNGNGDYCDASRKRGANRLLGGLRRRHTVGELYLPVRVQPGGWDSNTSTGVIPIRWPVTAPFSPAYFAKVTPMVRQNILITNSTFQGADPMLVNDTYNFNTDNLHLIADSTYFANPYPSFGNAISFSTFTNMQISIFPLGSTTTHTISWFSNNSNHLHFTGGSYEGLGFGIGEYPTHLEIDNVKMFLYGNNPFTVEGIDTNTHDNVISGTYASTNGIVADSFTSPNPYSYVYGQMVYAKNNISSALAGTGMIIYHSDTNLLMNQVTMSAAAVAYKFINSGGTPTNVIQGNVGRCNGGVASAGCFYWTGTAADGATITGNNMTGTGTLAYHILSFGSPASGAMQFTGNSQSGFSTSLTVTPASHPGSTFIDPTTFYSDATLPVFANLASGTQVSCLGLNSGNALVLSTGACGSSSGGVSSFNTRTGAVTLTSGDVTTALTYTPLSPANNLSDVASASTSRTNGVGNSSNAETEPAAQL